MFVGQLDGKLVALDQRTGRVAWSVQAERWQEGFTITSAPLYFDGLVYTGFAGGERGIRGRVKAFDARDGKLVWTFYTIPGPGEVGHDTWPQDNEIWMDGGAPVWNTPAVDPELGLIYFATGNPGPDYNGSIRLGDNLFSTSDRRRRREDRRIPLALPRSAPRHLGLRRGRARDAVRHRIERRAARKGLAHAGKTGWVYILDRTDGTPLVGIDERPVPQEPRQGTAATQPYPRGDAFIPQQIDIAPEGATLVNGGKIFTPFWTTPVLMKPGPPGGVNWPPSSYDPASGYLYVCAADRIWSYLSQEVTAERPVEGAGYIAGGIGGFHMTSLGVFAAVDVRTNELVWQQHWPGPCYSGSLATAGGLVFVGRSDGRLTALELGDRHEALGVSNGRRHELARDVVRAQRQAVRRRVFRGQSVCGLRARRQPVAVRLGRRARARAARGLADDVLAGRDGARRTPTPARPSTRRPASRATASKAKAATAAARRCRR